MPLTDKQKAWAEAYVGPAKFNASAAAQMAGVDPSTGREYRTKQNVIAYVEQLQAERLQGRVISQDRTLEEIFSIATSDLTDVFSFSDGGNLVVRDLDDLPRHVTCTIKKIKVTRRKDSGGDWEDVLELELHDKVKALALLAQHQGLLSGDPPTDQKEAPFAGIEIVAPPNRALPPKEDT